MKPKLFIVTGNAMKFRELSEKLSEFFDCEQKVLNEPEIQGSPEEILKHKITRAYEFFKQPVLVDDVIVHFEALNGFPGPYMKYFWECFTPYEMGVKFAGSRIQAVCHLGLYRKEGEIIVAEGVLNGKVIVPENKDYKDRYFDLFFQPDGMDKPMIDCSTEEKNEFSHRGLAMKNLIAILKKENI